MTAAANNKNSKKSGNGRFSRIVRYFKQVRLEMKKVVWPTKKELINSTISVLVFCLIVGVTIAILDLVVGELIINRLLNLG